MRLRYPIEPEEPPSVALARVVAELLGKDPLEVPPLAQVVDLDSLDRLLEGRGADAIPVRVDMEIAGHRLTVRPTEVVVVELDDDRLRGPSSTGRALSTMDERV